ncbi:MAG: helix-turn-helix transcriptional regulator, partial [Phycisphaeraceae bacterium]|nr:helix-turn-helix transcriptional regulator [Phycisphaeraceae bacterium]
AVLMDPCRTKAVKFSRVFRYSELRFRLEDASGTWGLRQPVLLLQQAYPLAGYIDQLAREMRMSPGRHSQIIANWLGLILAYAHRYSQQTLAPVNHLTTTQLDALIKYVQRHFGESIMPWDLAKVLHLSPDYFSRLFKSSLGQSPRAWLVRERIRRACHLLQYSLDNVDQVAREVGYSSTTHFCRQFRRMKGTTPSIYRLQVQ